MALRALIAWTLGVLAACGQVVELGPPNAADMQGSPSAPTGALLEAWPEGNLAEAIESAEASRGGRWQPRVRWAAVSRGPGAEDHFQRLGGALPLRARDGREPSLWFLEAEMLRADRGELGAAAAMVFRSAARSGREVQGWSLWADGRDAGPMTFRRVGMSWDSLAPYDETRFDIALPVGSAHARLPDAASTMQFGSTALPATIEGWTTALHQAECERGGLLLGDPAGVSLWGFAAGYHGQAAYLPQVWGVRVRGECRLGDACRLGAQYQADRVFGSRGFFSVECFFPGARPRGRRGELDLADLLYRPLLRVPAPAAAWPTRPRFP